MGNRIFFLDFFFENLYSQNELNKINKVEENH